MYPISTLYTDYLKRHDREFKVKANIAGTEYDDTSIVDFTIENSLAMGDEFELGTAIKSKLTIRIRTRTVIPANAKIVPYLALSLADMTWQQADYAWQGADFSWDGGTTSWLPLGEFYVDSREKVNDVWAFTCYDKLVWADVPYVSSLVYPTTQKAVWDEICTRLGFTYDSSVVINPAYQIQAGPAGYSYRQVMGYIAGANSASVFVGKDGKLKFKRFAAADVPVYELTASDYFRAKQLNPVKTYSRIVVAYNTEDGLTYEAGTGDENHTLYVENPFATQAITNSLRATLNGLSYMPVSMDARGFPQLEHGDCISFQRYEGGSWIETDSPWQDSDIAWDGIVRYRTYILHKVYSFKGGLKMSIEAPSKSEQQSEFVVEGTLSQQVNRLNNNAVKQGKSYYGATITRTAGLTIEREDHKSKVVLNSDEMTFYSGSDKAIWFDVPNNRFKFKGTLEAADGVFSGNLSAAGGTFSGDLVAAGGTFRGALQAASGTFAGALQAASGTFTGNLSAVGGTFTGTLIGVNGTFSGSITASTFTGGLIQSATTGKRIEMTNGKISVYNADNTLGMEIDSTGANPIINFYENGVLKANLFRSLGSTVFASEGSLLLSGNTRTNISNPLTINSGSAFDSIFQSNSSATTITGIVGDFNTLLNNLRNMNILA